MPPCRINRYCCYFAVVEVLHFFYEKTSEIFDIPHAFLSLTDAKLSALKSRPVLAHPAVVSYTKTGSHARVLKMSKNLVSQVGRAAPWLPPSGYATATPSCWLSVCLSVCHVLSHQSSARAMHSTLECSTQDTCVQAPASNRPGT